MPLIRIRDLKDGRNTEIRYSGSFDGRYEVKAGDFLIGMDGEFGCYEWRGDKALLNQRVCRLQEFSARLEPKFLFYAINKYLKEIENATTYTTVKHLSSKQIANIEFPLPPPLEQRCVVSILDEAFAGLATATANAEKNLKNARELFDSYLRSVFADQQNKWTTKTLGETCIVERGSSPRPIKNYVTDAADGENWVKIGDTKGITKYIKTTKEKITKKGAEYSRRVNPGDFILTNSMSFGRPYIMATTGYIHDGWFVLRLGKDIDRDYFYYLLISDHVQRQFGKLAAGAIVLNISSDLVKKAVLPIPLLAEQKRLAGEIAAYAAKTQRLEKIYAKKLDVLSKLRQSALIRAFSGELPSTRAQAIKEAAE